MKMLRRVLFGFIVRLGILLESARSKIAAASLPDFANKPKRLVVDLPRRINNPKRIHFGDDVKLGPNSVLNARTEYPGEWMRDPEGDHVSQEFDPAIWIGHRVTATSALQVTAFKEIVIEDDVMFAANVYISDGLHSTASAHCPYKFQGIWRVAAIRIGRGCWIGQNVVFMPGVTLGEFCVVGANSVVTSDLPAKSIAVGNPARVIKRWSSVRERWVTNTEDDATE